MKQKHALILLVLILLGGTVITYSNHFDNGFHFDDSHTINNNIYIRDLKHIPQIFTDVKTFGSMPNNLGYEPIVTSSTAVDYYFSKTDPLGVNKQKQYEPGLVPFYYHWPMFILFLLQGLLMFYMFLKIFNVSFKHEWNVYLALIAVAWYLLHPGNAETINYLIQRADSFSTFFVVFGLLLYMVSPVCRKWHLYLLPPLAGLLCKETATMFPAFLFVYIFFFEKKLSMRDFFRASKFRDTWGAIKKTLPAFLVMFAGIMAVQLLLYYQTPASGSLRSTTEGNYHFWYIMTQPYVLLNYFLQFFIPVGLNSDPDLEVFSSFANLRLWAGWLFIAGMLFVSWIASRTEKGRPIAFGFLWFLIASIPTSVLAALTQVANSHRLFFPYVGLTLAVVWAFYLFIQKIRPVFDAKAFSRTLVVVLCIMLGSYAYGTWQRNEVWHSDDSLWYDIAQKSPNNARALMNYGLSRMEAGDLFEAEYYYRKALDIWPNWLYLHINMGILKNAQQREDEAEQWFLSAINIGGQSQEPYFYYARFCYEHKLFDKAVANLQTAINISPADAKSRNLLMAIYAELQQWTLLAQLARETLQLVPGDPGAQAYLDMAEQGKGSLQLNEEAVNKNPTKEGYLILSLEYYNRGDFQQCIEACEQALRIDPNYAEAYNNICSAYNAMGQWQKGIEACEKALQIDPKFERARNNLNYAKANLK